MTKLEELEATVRAAWSDTSAAPGDPMALLLPLLLPLFISFTMTR
jgi:hypothetical protein